ncbi:MAG: CoA transferase, partial [Pelistega sp.]|nr:CoA transferase [Pelistega sp.]
VKARELWRTIPHPTAGSVPTVASPMFFSDTPIQYHRHPPLLGEHTEDILKEFGLEDF